MWKNVSFCTTYSETKPIGILRETHIVREFSTIFTGFITKKTMSIENKNNYSKGGLI